MSTQDSDLLSRHGVPNARGLVIRRRDDALAIGTKRGGGHTALVSAQNDDLFACDGIPDSRGPIGGCCDDARSVWTEGGGLDTACVSPKDDEIFSGRGVPYTRGLVVRRRNDTRTVNAKHSGVYAVFMSAQHQPEIRLKGCARKGGARCGGLGFVRVKSKKEPRRMNPKSKRRL